MCSMVTSVRWLTNMKFNSLNIASCDIFPRYSIWYSFARDDRPLLSRWCGLFILIKTTKWFPCPKTKWLLYWSLFWTPYGGIGCGLNRFGESLLLSSSSIWCLLVDPVSSSCYRGLSSTLDASSHLFLNPFYNSRLETCSRNSEIFISRIWFPSRCVTLGQWHTF